SIAVFFCSGNRTGFPLSSYRHFRANLESNSAPNRIERGKMGQTLESLYREIREQLRPVTRSPEQAGLEAKLILERVLAIPPEQILSRGEQWMDEDQRQRV